jgi:hypothetical protein
MQNKQSQTLLTSVIPAKAGIHHLAIPPSATPLDAGFHRHDVLYFASNCRALEKIWFLNFD